MTNFVGFLARNISTLGLQQRFFVRLGKNVFPSYPQIIIAFCIWHFYSPKKILITLLFSFDIFFCSQNGKMLCQTFRCVLFSWHFNLMPFNCSVNGKNYRNAHKKSKKFFWPISYDFKQKVDKSSMHFI